MSIFSKLFLTILSSSILAWLRDFVSRVTGDGGTLSDQGHTKEVYSDTYPYGPTLIQSCDSGGSTAQNFAVGSEDISNATYWFVASVTATSNAEPNPFGGSGVTLVAETGSTTAKGFYQQSAYQASIVSGQAYTVSAYVKKGDGSLAPDVIQVTYLSGGFGTDFYANYNINTGVVTKVNGGFADIEDVGGGWYRISLAGVATSSGSSGTFVFAFANNDPNANRFPSYTGNVNRDVYIWGVQFVQGNEPGEYIKTTTVAIDSIGTLYSAVVNPQALLETFTGSAAAYSLRSLSASTTNVVKVRRSSDDDELDFTSQEIESGYLLSWVTESMPEYLSDFSSNTDGFLGLNGLSISANVDDVLGVNDVLSAYDSGGGTQYIQSNKFDVGEAYELQFDYYIPNSQDINSIEVKHGLTTIGILNTTGSWQTTQLYSFVSSSTVLRIYPGQFGETGYIYIKNVSIRNTGLSSSGFVTTWYDQSGNTNNATQATAANQPKIVDSGSLVTENGNAAIDFDGTDDVLKSSDSSANGEDQAISAFITSAIDTSNAYRSVFAYYNTSSASDLYNIDFDNSGRIKCIIRDSSLTLKQPSSSASFYSAQQYLRSFISSGTLLNDYLNSVQGITNGDIDVGSITINGSSIGGRAYASSVDQYFIGTIQEIIIYPSDESANRTGIEGNINDYYNIYP